MRCRVVLIFSRIVSGPVPGTRCLRYTFPHGTNASWKPVKTMNDKIEPVSVVALRAECYSADRDSIVISLRTKYSTAERQYSIPVECLEDLIVDLKRLSVSETSSENAGGENQPLLPLETSIAAE